MTDPTPPMKPAPRPSPNQPRQTQEDTFGGRVSKLYSLTLAGAGDGIRGVGTRATEGWKRDVDRILAAQEFTSGFILKNPGGTLAGEPMQFTQWAQAMRTPGLSKIISEFFHAWQPVCDAYRNAGKEPIVYIGSFIGDKLWYQTPANERANLLRESLQDFAWSGFTFALDDFSQLSIPQRIAKKLDAIRVLKAARNISGRSRIYVEPLPGPEDEWANELHVGGMISNWNAAFKWKSSLDADTLPDFKGDVIVHIDNPAQIDKPDEKRGAGWELEDLRKCAAMGWHAAVPLDTGIPWSAMREALRPVTA